MDLRLGFVVFRRWQYSTTPPTSTNTPEGAGFSAVVAAEPRKAKILPSLGLRVKSKALTLPVW